MTTKLTLSIRKETVEKAKRYSAKNGKSVSKLVEDYLDGLEEKTAKRGFARIEELMAPHRDRINKKLPDGKSFKEIINDWREEDFQTKLGQSKQRKSSAKK